MSIYTPTIHEIPCFLILSPTLGDVAVLIGVTDTYITVEFAFWLSALKWSILIIISLLNLFLCKYFYVTCSFLLVPFYFFGRALLYSVYESFAHFEVILCLTEILMRSLRSILSLLPSICSFCSGSF